MEDNSELIEALRTAVKHDLEPALFILQQAADALEAYADQIQAVRDYLANRERLCEMEYEREDTWDTSCAYLALCDINEDILAILGDSHEETKE